MLVSLPAPLETAQNVQRRSCTPLDGNPRLADLAHCQNAPIAFGERRDRARPTAAQTDTVTTLHRQSKVSKQLVSLRDDVAYLFRLYFCRQDTVRVRVRVDGHTVPRHPQHDDNLAKTSRTNASMNCVRRDPFRRREPTARRRSYPHPPTRRPRPLQALPGPARKRVRLRRVERRWQSPWAAPESVRVARRTTFHGVGASAASHRLCATTGVPSA